MAIVGPTEESYRELLAHGGELTFEIDANDIDSSGVFEKSPLIAPYLNSGFELKPSPIIAEPENLSPLYLYGGSWTRVMAQVYTNGGKITYKKIGDIRYSATVKFPSKSVSEENSV